MARTNLTATVGTALTASVGQGSASSASLAASQSATAAINYTDVAADIATLVADGASPTQAHVTALNGHWTTLKGLIDAAVAASAAIAAGPAITGDVVLSVNGATVITKNKLDEILRAMRKLIDGSSLLT